MINKKKYKIFDYCWHISHQYDLMNALMDDCEFYLCLNIKRQWSEKGISQRPIPSNVTFVSYYEPGSYDLAILHIDQQVVTSEHQKRIIYDDFNNLITDIPKIVINHGTPVYPEGYANTSLNTQQMQNACVATIKQLIGNNVMVVNSHASASANEWGFGVPIVHGINPDDWSDLKKEPRVFTAISPNGLDAYYNRDCLNSVEKELFEIYGYYLWYAKKNVPTHHSFEKYKEFLGRSLLYLDVSFRTPMNRARTEAFLSGCCVIQVEGAHDLERWAINNENIIIVPNNPAYIANLIVNLIENDFDKALQIGNKGREMAIKEFNRQKYRKTWLELIKTTIKHFNDSNR